MKPVSTDAWEGCPVCGRDSCEDPSHVPPPLDGPLADSVETNSFPKEKPSSLPESTVSDFVSASEVAEQTAPESVIEDAVFRGCVSVLAAPSGAGKSFVGMNGGASVAEGRNWHGREVIQGSVCYIGFEADALSKRLQAIQRQGYTLENLYILRASDPISPSIQRDGTETASIGEAILTDRLIRLAAKLKAQGRPPIVLVIFDTVRASLTGSEDSSSDVSAYLRSVRRLLGHLPGAGALLLHHSGWQDGQDQRKRERGSSAFRGNVECTLYLEVTDDDDTSEVCLELKTLKVRDSEKRVPMRLIRGRVDLLGFDKFKQPLTSCIIERDPRSFEEMEAERQAEEEASRKAEQVELLRQVLAVIRNNQITSQDALRAFIGCARPTLQMAVARILQDGLATRTKQRDPFVITDAGKEFLA